jgi:hypothetical protein
LRERLAVLAGHPPEQLRIFTGCVSRVHHDQGKQNTDRAILSSLYPNVSRLTRSRPATSRKD